jgi:hypothetical protein
MQEPLFMAPLLAQDRHFDCPNLFTRKLLVYCAQVLPDGVPHAFQSLWLRGSL